VAVDPVEVIVAVRVTANMGSLSSVVTLLVPLSVLSEDILATMIPTTKISSP
jgi:hypothetical protein